MDNKLRQDISLSLSAESVYISFMRNCIILFTLGLTIINFTKNRRKEKYILAFIVILTGIIMGSICIIEYMKRINNIKTNNLDKINLISDTVYVSIVLLILFVLLMIYKFININEKYKILKF